MSPSRLTRTMTNPERRIEHELLEEIIALRQAIEDLTLTVQALADNVAWATSTQYRPRESRQVRIPIEAAE